MAEEDELTLIYSSDFRVEATWKNQVYLYKNQEKLMKKLIKIQKMIEEVSEKYNSIPNLGPG